MEGTRRTTPNIDKRYLSLPTPQDSQRKKESTYIEREFHAKDVIEARKYKMAENDQGSNLFTGHDPFTWMLCASHGARVRAMSLEL